MKETNDNGGSGGVGLEISADVGLKIGKLADEMEAERKRRQRDALDTPARVQVASNFTFSTAAGAGICTQGGTGFGVVLGGPDLGYQWSVRQAIVAGSVLSATPAGVGWLFASAAPPTEQMVTNVLDFTHTPLPSNAFYSVGELYITQNESLYLVVTGGTNGTGYAVSVVVEISRYAAAQGLEYDI